MFENHIQLVSLTERYRFLGFAPPSRGRLGFDIVYSAHRTVHGYRGVIVSFVLFKRPSGHVRENLVDCSVKPRIPRKSGLAYNHFPLKSDSSSHQVTPLLELGTAESFI